KPNKPRKIPSEKNPPERNESKPQPGPSGQASGPIRPRSQGKNTPPKSINRATPINRKTPLTSHKVASKWICFRTRPSARDATAGMAGGTARATTAFPQEAQHCAPETSGVPQRSQDMAEPSTPYSTLLRRSLFKSSKDILPNPRSPVTPVERLPFLDFPSSTRHRRS